MCVWGSPNGGTPKSSTLIKFSLTNHLISGIPSYGNHINIYIYPGYLYYIPMMFGFHQKFFCFMTTAHSCDINHDQEARMHQGWKFMGILMLVLRCRPLMVATLTQNSMRI